MGDSLVCWKCGAGVDDQPLPLARLAECTACSADLHVCLMCGFYDTRVAKACRETIAEEVKDKHRSNFCDYFEARSGAYAVNDDSAARGARAQLDALFGAASPDASPADSDASRSALDDLFGLKKD